MSGAVIYARISDDRGGSGLGVARQEKDCRRLCEKEGWPVSDVIVDNDTSAYSGKRRPGYERLLDGLKAGSWAVVVAWHPDRLHRSPKELEQFIDIIESSGVQVSTVTAGVLDLASATGRMTARVVGAMARHSSEQAAERIRRKHQELAEQGHPVGGGTRPFGYLPDRVTLDPVEAALVRDAARQILDGVPLRAIARAWSDIPTVTGTPWTTTVIRRILTSPRAAGFREHGGNRYPGTWEPLLDEMTWRRVRAVLLDPSRRVNSAPRSYLLTGGLAVCKLCDAALVARPRSDKARCYVCATGPAFHGCGKIRVLAEPLEEDVTRTVADRLAASPLPDTGTGNDLLIRIDQTEAHLTELADDYYSHRSITRAQFQAASSTLQARLDQLRSDAARITTVPTDALAALASDDLAVRRPVIAAVVERVTVGPAVRGRNFYDSSRVTVTFRA